MTDYGGRLALLGRAIESEKVSARRGRLLLGGRLLVLQPGGKIEGLGQIDPGQEVQHARPLAVPLAGGEMCGKAGADHGIDRSLERDPAFAGDLSYPGGEIRLQGDGGSHARIKAAACLLY